MRAFAQQFTTAYLTFDPARPDDRTRALSGMLASGLRDDSNETGPRQSVTQTMVSHAVPLSSTRALITVAANVRQSGRTTVRYLTVPVSDRDGLVVDDFPAFTNPPAPGTAPTPPADENPVDSEVAPELSARLERFLGAYLTGDQVAPEFLAPGAVIHPLGHRYRLVQLVSIATTGPTTQTHQRVLATVLARDKTTGTTFMLRYRITVALVAGRWLTQNLQT
jgi:hypothetical protein